MPLYDVIIDDVIFFLKLKCGIVLIFLPFKSVSREVEKPKTVCTYDKYWMRYDSLKLEKPRLNKSPLQ